MGSDIRVHITFFVLIAWIGMAAYADGGAASALWNVSFVLALFACVVAHEFGHALMARRYGIKTPSVTLLPIGGVAQLDRIPERPSAEIAVALAGPAVTLAIFLILTLVFGADVRWASVTENGAYLNVPALLDQLAVANLYLLVFNLIPAFPMDGGRVLRAFLSSRSGRVKGTAIAAGVGRTIAVLFGLLGLWSGNPILVLVAAFVFIAGGMESSAVALREVASGLLARDAAITEFRSLTAADPVSAAVDAIIHTTQHEFPVVNAAGQAVGFLSRQAVFKAIAEGRGDAMVAELMKREFQTARSGAPLKDAIERLSQDESGVVLIEGTDRRLEGYITRENLGELMLVKRGRD